MNDVYREFQIVKVNESTSSRLIALRHRVERRVCSFLNRRRIDEQVVERANAGKREHHQTAHPNNVDPPGFHE